MNAKYRLKDKRQFDKVIKKGKKVKSKNYIVYFLPSFERRIGITIGKKMGNAPVRNYHKRVIRSICYQNINKFPNVDVVIIGRDELKVIDYNVKTLDLIKLIERINIE